MQALRTTIDEENHALSDYITAGHEEMAENAIELRRSNGNLPRHIIGESLLTVISAS